MLNIIIKENFKESTVNTYKALTNIANQNISNEKRRTILKVFMANIDEDTFNQMIELHSLVCNHYTDRNIELSNRTKRISGIFVLENNKRDLAQKSLYEKLVNIYNNFINNEDQYISSTTITQLNIMISFVVENLSNNELNRLKNYTEKFESNEDIRTYFINYITAELDAREIIEYNNSKSERTSK